MIDEDQTVRVRYTVAPEPEIGEVLTPRARIAPRVELTDRPEAVDVTPALALVIGLSVGSVVGVLLTVAVALLAVLR